MTVQLKLALGMLMLAAVVIALSVFVYISATSNPLQEDSRVTPVRPTAIQATSGIGFDTLLPTRQDSQETRGESEKTAVVTLESPTEVLEETKNTEPPVVLNKSEATYTVRMHASWSNILHTDWYPSGAHLSPMVAWSHRLTNTVFTVGQTASDGMEQMAETGATATLEEEIESLGTNGYLLNYAIGERIDAPGEDTVSLLLSVTAPYASVVSMIAPSPDWFITAQNVQLFENGQWIERVSVPAVLYDAGTDSGTRFTSRNSDTRPAQPIARLTDAPTIPIATFEFIRTN